MPLWQITKEWEWQNAYIIGGGASLSKFNFNRLAGQNTIGCNDAFRLGPGIIKICAFGDHSWWVKNYVEVAHWAKEGRLVTNSPQLMQVTDQWLLQVPREKWGLTVGGKTLTWNYSTGAMAIHLALLLGASRIYLLGFDLCCIRDQHHWHQYRNRRTGERSFSKFREGFSRLFHDMHKFPDAKVINVTDGTSQLPFFDRIHPDELSLPFEETLDLEPVEA